MISIQKAGSESIPQIQALVNIIWPATYESILPAGQASYMLQKMYNTQALQQQMADGVQFIIVYHQEMPVGFAAYSALRLKDDVFKLHKIYVLPNQQGKGIGKMLIDYVVAEMAPARQLQLNVNRQNPARFFYEKLGFRILESVDIPIGNNFFMQDFIMQLSLPFTSD